MDNKFEIGGSNTPNAALEISLQVNAIQQVLFEMMCEILSFHREQPVKEIKLEANKMFLRKKEYVRDYIFAQFGKMPDLGTGDYNPLQ